MTTTTGNLAAAAALFESKFWIRALDSRHRTDVFEEHVPAWVHSLAGAFTDFAFDDAETTPVSPMPTSGPAVLAEAVKPLVRQAEVRLAHGVDKLLDAHPDARSVFDADTVMPWLLMNLKEQIWPKLTRTVALEVNIARLEGRLQGADPRERFRNFLDQLAQGETLLNLLLEYPVLAQQLVLACENSIDASLEILDRLCRDLPMLRTTFSSGCHPGRLVSFPQAAGDSHRGNRSVVTLSFESGLRLVYKPKPMAVDIHFQNLLCWLNEHQPQLDLRVLTVLDRGRYGWSEYVDRADCTSSDGVAAFYRRLGGQLALLYALDATDFHCENLIAAGEHPVLIDLESLFHPHVEDGPSALDESDPASATIGYSVLRVGILPDREGSRSGSVGIDMTGIGGRPGQLSPHPIAVWAGFATDEMQVVKQQIELQGADNRPRLDGNDAVASDYLDDFTEGFRATYEILMAHSEELVAGPLACFGPDELRVIVRSTKTYNNLLRQSFHPDLLRDAQDRQRHFQHLGKAIEWQPYLARLLDAECEDLLTGDIPMFTTRPDTLDLYTSRGEVLKDFFKETSLQMVTRRMRSLSSEDLDRQLWFIGASFAAIPLAESTEGWRPSRLCPVDDPVTTEHLVAAAKAVGDRLATLAIHQDDGANWVGLSLETEREWQLRAAGVDLYSGMPGIILFLAYAGVVSGETAYTTLARQALRTLERQQRLLERFKAQESIGAFNGLGSSIYLLSHLGALWNEPALLDEAERLSARLDERIGDDTAFDIMAGTAGSVLALLSLHAVRPTSAVLATAVRCGEHLLAHAQAVSGGLGWLNPLLAAEPLAGFSHGAAGIAYGLLKLGKATGQLRFHDAGMAGLAYERALFSADAQNWPDLRKVLGEKKGSEFMAVWCHGAAGIGLGRLGSLSSADTVAVREDIDIALRTTLRDGFGLNHCLCHGDLGALDLLLVATQHLTSEEHRHNLATRTAMVFDSIERYGWLTGLPRSIETPGLMTGIAGIGYQLLRLAHPEQVPSVLLLDPPRAGRYQRA